MDFRGTPMGGKAEANVRSSDDFLRDIADFLK